MNTYPHRTMVYGLRLKMLGFFLTISRLKMVFAHVKNPLKGIKLLRGMLALRSELIGSRSAQKMSKVGAKYRWALYVPAWPSNTWNQFFRGELNRRHPIAGKSNRFINVFVAITKKCSLQCEHCFEWEALNGKEKLSLADLKVIVKRISDMGVSQIQLSGGEPMLRFQDLLEVIGTGPKEVEFWLLTSGLNLTADNASRLKAAGLTGVVVSLDHFEPELHNQFRGYQKAFYWAGEAIKNANNNGMVTAISICVTRPFVTESNLMAYAELAKEWGVSFIQVLEPKAVGHYDGKDVALLPEQEKLLEAFYLKLNYEEGFRQYPLVSYHGFYQRRIGCLSSGSRSFYVDTNGDMHACPFCRKVHGNMLEDHWEENLESMGAKGCMSFKGLE